MILVSGACTAYGIFENRILFIRNFTAERNLRRHAMMFIRNVAVRRSKCQIATGGGDETLQDNDTSVIRGPAIMKAGWLKANEAA